MTRGEFPRLAVKAILISVLIQVPFVILITFGVHSAAGGIGYAFYYPWLIVLESLDRIVGGNWENNVSATRTPSCKDSRRNAMLRHDQALKEGLDEVVDVSKLQRVPRYRPACPRCAEEKKD